MTTTDTTSGNATVEDPEIELWESTIPGRIYITRLDSRGNDQSIPVPGHGRLRIRRRDRVMNQERVLDTDSDVFSNGKLRRVGEGYDASPEQQLERHEYTRAAFQHVIQLDDATFRTVVDEMEERGVRLLKDSLTELGGTMTQAEYVQNVIVAKFQPYSRAMPSSAELISDPEDDLPFS